MFWIFYLPSIDISPLAWKDTLGHFEAGNAIRSIRCSDGMNIDVKQVMERKWTREISSDSAG